MPVELSVKQVREALQHAAGGDAAGDGEPATRLLGALFHQVFADLVGSDPARSGVRVAFESDRADAAERLIAHTYRALVGPRLSRHQAVLQRTSAEVVTFWQATQNLARWIADLVATVIEARRDQSLDWEDVAGLISAEAALDCEIQEPGWTDSVSLVGIADAILRVPGRDGFCAVELKLGRARPAVDLGQVALYRLIASRGVGSSSRGALALVRFSPAIDELLIEGRDLGGAEARLLDLVARLAGVAPAARTASTKRAAATPPPQYADLAQKLVRAFREYGRAVDVASAPAVGPRFLRFEAKLGRGVTFDQVARLTTEVRLKLGLGKEPIVTKDGGRLCIDVERPDPQAVPFSVVEDALGPRDARGSARLPIGVDLGGTLRFADLSSPINAHLLVAGTTGSGKTEWLRTAVAGLLHANTAETLRFVLIDPKLAAFQELKASPYLWSKRGLWVPGDGDVVELLDDLIAEMERRYALIAAAGVDDLGRYVEKTGAVLPRIVCFCDEYFALVSQDRQQKKHVEGAIALLGAKARAAGIHLVIATQQPSRQVIQGALDANIPCRVGLMTQSAIESRMLLGVPGAERLTGFGDLLYRDVGEPVRLQAPYLTPVERARSFGVTRA